MLYYVNERTENEQIFSTSHTHTDRQTHAHAKIERKSINSSVCGVFLLHSPNSTIQIIFDIHTNSIHHTRRDQTIHTCLYVLHAFILSITPHTHRYISMKRIFQRHDTIKSTRKSVYWTELNTPTATIHSITSDLSLFFYSLVSKLSQSDFSFVFIFIIDVDLYTH